MITVLRLGHRAERDKRLSTHVALVARAFGADNLFYTGDYDQSLENSVNKVVEKWGGAFKIEYTSSWKTLVKTWTGKIVHLTMYGLPLKTVIDEIRTLMRQFDLLVIVGGEKVEGEVFQVADYNVAVTSQPHSEAAALAVFLDWVFQGTELDKVYPDALFSVVPSAKGKIVKRRGLLESDFGVDGLTR
ncbi:MAG: tRNA (cytidine(56)-2'-O)-methyltransferase [Aigarchaeota archaeon]|nr:tRNA (cytidine(56)-2'-O)-methyltransferase [Candidatus Caldarchaeales archaeon]MDJ0273094.1 tRNA (cytidine(56)-2'-O)-methyltransferase [Candidatus Caldarchaeales archaeon]